MLFDFDYTIDAGNNFFLSDIIGGKYYDNMTDQVNKYVSFLNKGVCGNGGTSGFVRYALENNKGLLILVPNVSIVVSKEEEKYRKNQKDVCCVYGGKDNIDFNAQVVIATYDQYPRLKKYLTRFGYNTGNNVWDSEFWSGRTVIVDEYHTLVKDSGYREICSDMSYMMMNVQSPVVFLSATPDPGFISMVRDILPDRKIVSYNVKYPKRDEYAQHIEYFEFKQTELPDVMRKLLDSPNIEGHICVFYNSVKNSLDIVNSLNDPRCEILCSKDRKDKVGGWYSDKMSKDRKLHFLTSAYYAGFDIDMTEMNVERCIIIGSPEKDHLIPNERDIKQIMGRFRYEGGGVRRQNTYIFRIPVFRDKKNYGKSKDTYEINRKIVEEFNEIYELKGSAMRDYVRRRQDKMRAEDILHAFDMWGDKKNLEKCLTDYGFFFKTGKKLPLDKEKKNKTLSFKNAKTMIMEGKDVTPEMYPYAYELKMYHEKVGLTKHYVSIKEIINTCMVWDHIGDDDVDELVMEERYKAVGLEPYGRYKESYLMSMMKVLGIECDRDTMPFRFKEYFGGDIVRYNLDNKKNEKNDTWIFIKNLTVNLGLELLISSNSSYKEKRPKLTILTPNLQHKKNVSVRTNIKGETRASTVTLTEDSFKRLGDSTIRKRFDPMDGMNVLDFVNLYKDKFLKKKKDILSEKKNEMASLKEEKHRLLSRRSYVKRKGGSYLDIEKDIDRIKSEIENLSGFISDLSDYKVKESNTFSSIKNFDQTLMSEMYSDEKTEYPHKREYMDRIDYIICDIDGGISFSQFRDVYKEWKFIAYPSISNITEDWTKFRVIFPLDSTIILGKGQYNLQTLKILRSMLCAYEDGNHQIGAYCNREDFEKRYENDGETYHLDQSMVDELQQCIADSKDYTYMVSFEEKDVKVKEYTIEDAKRFFTNVVIPSNEDGEHHRLIGKMKLRMDPADYQEMGKWIMSGYGKRYYDHFASWSGKGKKK